VSHVPWRRSILDLARKNDLCAVASEAWNSFFLVRDEAEQVWEWRFGGGHRVRIQSGWRRTNNACPRCAFAASKGIEVAGATGAMRRGKYGKYGASGNRIPVCL
jgi:hypothetical protein